MERTFELAGGSVIGKKHRNIGRNNQDNYAMYQDRDITIAVVADGCGSTPYSEIGANLGSRMFVDMLAQNIQTKGLDFYEEPLHWAGNIPSQLPGFTQRLGCALRVLTSTEDEFHRTVAETCLFTLCCVVITPRDAHFFAIGDGVFVINGDTTIIESEKNRPNYLGYQLFADAPEPVITNVALLDTNDIESFVVGSDGVSDLLASAAKPLPGKAELLGPLDQFWSEDKFFTNPEAINRRLRLANTEHTRFDREANRLVTHHGLLDDDTTLVVGRRVKPIELNHDGLEKVADEKEQP